MPQKTSHPTPEELSAYSLGKLPLDEAKFVESHVSECRACCETMLGLSSEDTFVDLLKEAKQLPMDQTAAHNGIPANATSSCHDIPEPLANHPRYEILELVGKGGMGDVYKARHRMMERTVALKIINRELMQKPEAVDRFHREVKGAAQLSHPNIVTAHDADQAGDVHFMVMEYVDGVDLSQTVKDRGPLPIPEACDSIRQAAIGLQHAHERGMVHRDIKPHNLMVTTDGTVKILDFGIASLAPATLPDAEQVESDGDLTVAGAIMGTPDFISPEQADDARQADIRSDIYSLGMTLYYLLAGHAPFADGSVMHKLESHAQAEPEPLESLRDDVPAELVAVVAKMTAKDPDERFQTPAEVAEALESILADPRPTPKTIPQQKLHSRRKRRWRWPLVATATLFVAAIVATMIYMSTRPDRPFMVGSGPGDGSHGWYFRSGCIYLNTNEPGVLFGMYEDSQGNRNLSYALLIRHDISDLRDFFEAGTEHESNQTFDSGGDGGVASGNDHITIGGKGVELDLEVEVDRQRVKSIDIAIDGEPVDTTNGRLFLVDLTSDAVTWEQVDAQFPVDLPDPEDALDDPEVVTELAGRLTRQLTEDKEEVRAFLTGERDLKGRPSHEVKNRKPEDLLVGEWRGTADEDKEVRVTFDSNGTFEMVVADPARLQRTPTRATGKYTTDFSVSPAHLDLDASFDPGTKPPLGGYDGPPGTAPAVGGAESRRVEKHKLKTIIEPMDANTLRMAEPREDSRPEAFGEQPLVLRRQGTKKVDPTDRGEPAEAAPASDGASAAGDPGASPDGKPVSECAAIQAALREYYMDKYPLFAASVNQNSKILSDPSKLRERERLRQIDELGANSPVSEVINSFPGKPYVTFTEVTEASRSEVLVVCVNLYRNADGTCRVEVTKKQRKKRAGEPVAVGKPITEEDVHKLVRTVAEDSDFNQLQGDWEVIAFTQNGTKEFAADKDVSMQLHFEDNTLSRSQTKPNGEKSEKEWGHIELNSRTNPKSIDIVNPDGPGGRLLGIYNLKEGALKLCFAEQRDIDVAEGRPVKRPTTFAAPGGSNLVLLECRRNCEQDQNSAKSLPLMRVLQDTEKYHAKRVQVIGTLWVRDTEWDVRTYELSTARENLPPGRTADGDSGDDLCFEISFVEEDFPNMGMYHGKRVAVTGKIYYFPPSSSQQAETIFMLEKIEACDEKEANVDGTGGAGSQGSTSQPAADRAPSPQDLLVGEWRRTVAEVKTCPGKPSPLVQSSG